MPFKNKKISGLGEFGLINQLHKLIKVDKKVICGIGDDTAVLKYTKDKYLLFTTDMLIEGVHFTRNMPAEAIGRKALAVNISDIAAMGGLPLYAVISLGLPKGLNAEFVIRIYKGMLKLAREFKVNIVGGDTNKSKDITINVSLIGEVEKKNLVLRKGAKNGDLILATGALGKSLESNRHLNFIPRVSLARALVKRHKPSAMIDISDGLILDLSHILELSGKGAVIYERLIPRNPGASLKDALYGGEDFELLFTLPKKFYRGLLNSLKKAGSNFHIFPIGEITNQKGKILLVNRLDKLIPLAKKGFTHF